MKAFQVKHHNKLVALRNQLIKMHNADVMLLKEEPSQYIDALTDAIEEYRAKFHEDDPNHYNSVWKQVNFAEIIANPMKGR